MSPTRWGVSRSVAFLALSWMVWTGASAVFAAGLGAGKIWLQVPSPSDFDGVPALGDMDGDGRQDLIVYNQTSGVVRVGLSTGTSFGPLRTWATRLPTRSDGDLFPYVVADVTGDGKGDLVVFMHGDGQAPGSADVLVVNSDGLAFATTRRGIWNAGFCVTDQTCHVGDINGDGKADLVAFTQNFGLVWTSLSNGSSFGVNTVWHNFFCVRFETCALGDTDGDRMADLLTFKQLATGVEQGNVLVAASTGASFGAPRLGHGFFCIAGERCLVGDLNGDNRDDILLVKRMADPRAEVLVSLSDGERFINANPFQFGEPERVSGATGWSAFYLGDVTGDGRDDLVNLAIVGVTQPGGGQQTVGRAYVVYPVVEQTPGTPGDAPAPAEPGGVEHLLVANCDPDRHPLTYWIADNTTGEITQDGPHDALYAESGHCPDQAQEMFSFDFEPGHLYDFAAVDPLSIGCEGQNDPTVVGCGKHRHSFLGSSNGKTAYLNLQAGPSLNIFALKISLPQARLEELRLAGIDFSVDKDEILDWLGNDFSAYIQFSGGLLALLEGRRLRRPVFIDVVFFDYEQSGGKIALNVPEGALDAEKVHDALLSAHNVRYGEAVSDWTSLLED